MSFRSSHLSCTSCDEGTEAKNRSIVLDSNLCNSVFCNSVGFNLQHPGSTSLLGSVISTVSRTCSVHSVGKKMLLGVSDVRSHGTGSENVVYCRPLCSYLKVGIFCGKQLLKCVCSQLYHGLSLGGIIVFLSSGVLKSPRVIHVSLKTSSKTLNS
jgi:hypothetical protein